MNAMDTCTLCEHYRDAHDDATGCLVADCPCGGFVPHVTEREPLPIAPEPEVELRLCTACDHPATSHHPVHGCQQLTVNGIFGKGTCPCALAPQVFSAVLDVANERTAQLLADVAQGKPDEDPLDVAHASFLLGLLAGSLHRLGYRPDEHDPHVITVPLAGNRVARVWCQVGPSGEPF